MEPTSAMKQYQARITRLTRRMEIAQRLTSLAGSIVTIALLVGVLRPSLKGITAPIVIGAGLGISLPAILTMWTTHAGIRTAKMGLLQARVTRLEYELTIPG